MTLSEKKTLADEVEQMAAGEPILGIVLGGNRDRWEEDDPAYKSGAVLTWDEARPHIDYVYDHGYGGVDCHALTAWTESRVIFVHEYDGSSGLVYVPRNPVEHKPDYSGLYGDLWDDR